MTSGSTAREPLDLDAIEAEARDHRRITDVGRHVLQLVSEVRRLRARVAELEGPKLCEGCKKYPGSCMCVVRIGPDDSPPFRPASLDDLEARGFRRHARKPG